MKSLFTLFIAIIFTISIQTIDFVDGACVTGSKIFKNLNITDLEKIKFNTDSVIKSLPPGTLTVNWVVGETFELKIEYEYPGEKYKLNVPDVDFNSTEANTLITAFSVQTLTTTDGDDKNVDGTNNAISRNGNGLVTSSIVAIMSSIATQDRKTIAVTTSTALLLNALTAIEAATAPNSCEVKITVTITVPRGSRWESRQDSGSEVTPPEFGLPCFEDPKCKELGGVCKMKPPKDIPNNQVYISALCGSDFTNPFVKSCGCLITVKPPTVPTVSPTIPLPCKESDTCKQKGGFCVKSKQTCPILTHYVDPTLCRPDNYDGPADGCMCCIPFSDYTLKPTSAKTESPTSIACPIDDKCAIIGGKCLSDKNLCLPPFIVAPNLCKAADGEISNCFCCIKPPPPTRKPTSQSDTFSPTSSTIGQCNLDDTSCPNQRCVTDSSQCKDTEFFNPLKCKKYDAAGIPIPSKCGCCEDASTYVSSSPTTSNGGGDLGICKLDSRCSDITGAYCVEDWAKCDLTTHDLDKTLCTSYSSYGKPFCGCCKPKQACAIDARCKEGCVNSPNKCPTGTVFNPAFCGGFGTTGAATCGCCVKEIETATIQPTVSNECSPDETCKALPLGVCVPNKDVCDQIQTKANPEYGKFIFDDTKCGNGVACGCCFFRAYEKTFQPSRSPIRSLPPSSKCFDRDPVCFKLNGRCVTNPNDCPVGFYLNKDLCGEGKDCACCIKLENPPTDRPTEPPTRLPPICIEQDPICAENKGFCVRNSLDCPFTTHYFKPQLCKNPNNENPLAADESKCGCCIPFTPPPTIEGCAESTTCAQKGGKCVKSIDQCPSDYAFDNSLCQIPGVAPGSCGCCSRKPPATESPFSQDSPCIEQDDKCKAIKGKCVRDLETCRKLSLQYQLPLLFSNELCSKNSTTSSTDACGCCFVDPTVTPPPTQRPIVQDEPCLQDDRCYPGKCMNNRQLCESLGKWFDPTTCNMNGGSVTNCGCCRDPITKSPTIETPCATDDVCAIKYGGKCMTDKSQCPLWDPRFVFDTTLCSKDGICGCCRKALPTEKPTIQGEPACTSYDTTCEALKGKCVPKDGACNLDLNILEPNLCADRTAGDNTDDCACCFPKPPNNNNTPSPTTSNNNGLEFPCIQDDKCTSNGGRCANNKSECDPLHEFPIQDGLCRPQIATAQLPGSENCVCCMKKPN